MRPAGCRRYENDTAIREQFWHIVGKQGYHMYPEVWTTKGVFRAGVLQGILWKL